MNRAPQVQAPRYSPLAADDLDARVHHCQEDVRDQGADHGKRPYGQHQESGQVDVFVLDGRQQDRSYRGEAQYHGDDDAATGQALLNYFLHGISYGAITEEETKTTGLTLEEIRSRSFTKILQGRQL